MKKFKSEIVELKNKIKWLKLLKYYPVAGLALLIAFIGLDIFAGIKGLWALGGIFTGLAIVTGIVTLCDGIMGVDKLIDAKIEQIEKNIEEIKNENAFENQVYQIYQHSSEQEQKKLITQLIKNKKNLTEKVNKLNPNLDIEVSGEDNNFTL